LIRTLKAAAVTVALSTAALVSTPVAAFADQSHGRPVALHCDSCRLPKPGTVIDRGRDDHRGTGPSHRGGTVVDRGQVVENHRGVIADRRDHHRRDRTVVIDVSRNAQALLLRSQHPGSDWPNALTAGSKAVRVHTVDSADYRARYGAGSVQIVVNRGTTQCRAQGHLRCEVQGANLVRVYRG